MKQTLNQYFQKEQCGEIGLFREMLRYLTTKYNCIFIDEVHQKYVEFDTLISNCKKKRELSDLWIITYSPILQKAKMTFLQAKFDKNTKIKSGILGFTGDYFQYDLLSRRPHITKCSKKMNFPKTILSDAISDSVGSFGVFYFDSKNKIDFAFSVASDLSGKKKATCNSKARKLYFNVIGKSGTKLKISKKTGIELRSCLNVDCFEYGLMNLFIGTPIEEDYNLIDFLEKYIGKNLSVDLRDFTEFISQLNKNNNLNSKYSIETDFVNFRILLINIDLNK